MKNTLVLLSLAALFFASCSKEENSFIPANEPQAGNTLSAERISTVPSKFDQKILLENFTSVAHGKCPLNDYLIDQVMAEHQGQVIAASFHRNDIMKTAATSQLFDLAGGTDPLVLPAIMMNRTIVDNSRIIGDDSWTSLIEDELRNTPECGLAIKSEFDAVTNKIKLTVHAGFSADMQGNYNVCAYLIEDHVRNYEPAYNQANAYDRDEQSPFFEAGNPIAGYPHKNVLRKTITSVSGIPVPAASVIAGGHWIKNLSAILPHGARADECSVVAFIYDKATLRVMNVQQAQLGTVKDWN